MTSTPDAPEASSGGATDEGTAAGVRRLETELRIARRNSKRALKRLHAKMLADVRAAERRARTAERKAESAEKRALANERLLRDARQRASRAEQEVADVRASSTWKAGRAVVAVPARIKRLRGR